MNLEKYTQKTQSSISDAQSIARDLSHPSIEPEHLLLALLQQPTNHWHQYAGMSAGLNDMLV